MLKIISVGFKINQESVLWKGFCLADQNDKSRKGRKNFGKICGPWNFMNALNSTYGESPQKACHGLWQRMARVHYVRRGIDGYLHLFVECTFAWMARKGSSLKVCHTLLLVHGQESMDVVEFISLSPKIPNTLLTKISSPFLKLFCCIPYGRERNSVPSIMLNLDVLSSHFIGFNKF